MKWRSLLQSQYGFTLVEVILASALLVTILGAGINIFESTQTRGQKVTNEALAAQGAAVVLTEAVSVVQGANSFVLNNATDPNDQTKTIQTLTALFPDKNPTLINCAYNLNNGIKSNLVLTIQGKQPAVTGSLTDFQMSMMGNNAVQFTATVTVKDKSVTRSRTVRAQVPEIPHVSISVTNEYDKSGELTGDLIVAGDNYLKFNNVTIPNTIVWLKWIDGGNIKQVQVPADCLQQYYMTINPPGQQISEPTEDLEILDKSIKDDKGKELNPLRLIPSNTSCTLILKQTITSPASGSSVPVVAAAQFIKGSNSGGNGGSATAWSMPHNTSSGDWLPNNSFINYLFYLISDYDNSGWPFYIQNSHGYLLINPYLCYLEKPWGSPTDYACIYSKQPHTNSFDYSSRLMFFDMGSRWGGNGDRTAGLVFYAPNRLASSGFLYFGVQQTDDGRVYAVYRDFRNPGSDYVKLAQIGNSLASSYKLRVVGNNGQLTFYVNDSQVGSESVSGLDGNSGYAGVWQNWPRMLSVYTF
ncbi:MAG TPA: hypothetical protein GXX25_03225 [Desulfotomaculum sp.]|nr:hypothetical protein [Desulfotomaculum sp.]